MFSFNFRIALLGLATLTAALTAPGCQKNACCPVAGGAECKERCVETPVALADVPAPVRATIEREAAGGGVEEVEMCRKDGKVCYCADVALAGREYKLCIAEDGTLLRKTLEK